MPGTAGVTTTSMGARRRTTSPPTPVWTPTCLTTPPRSTTRTWVLEGDQDRPARRGRPNVAAPLRRGRSNGGRRPTKCRYRSPCTPERHAMFDALVERHPALLIPILSLL